MEFRTRLEDDITVVDLLGNLDTHTSGTAAEELARIAQGASKLLLNLEGLEFLSSAGLRVLLRTSKQLKRAGGATKICGAKGTVLEVLEISGLDTLMDLHVSEREALSAF